MRGKDTLDVTYTVSVPAGERKRFSIMLKMHGNKERNRISEYPLATNKASYFMLWIFLISLWEATYFRRRLDWRQGYRWLERWHLSVKKSVKEA
jgi:hypothetical protein